MRRVPSGRGGHGRGMVTIQWSMQRGAVAAKATVLSTDMRGFVEQNVLILNKMCCILQGYNIPFTPWQLRVYSQVCSSGRPAWPRGALAKRSTKLANQCARSLAQLHTLFKTNGDPCRFSQAKFCFKLFCVGWIQHCIRAAGGG